MCGASGALGVRSGNVGETRTRERCCGRSTECRSRCYCWGSLSTAARLWGICLDRLGGKRMKRKHEQQENWQTDRYYVGQKVETTYTDAPVSNEQMYPIGTEVDISDDGNVLAVFVVDETDNTTIKGTVTWVLWDIRTPEGMDEIKIEDLQRVRLERGDVLLVKLKARVTDVEMARIKGIFEPFFPNNGVLIISEDDAELSIVEQGA